MTPSRCAVAGLLALLLAAAAPAASAQAERARIRPLTPAERRSLEEQRQTVRELARRHVGSVPTGESLYDLTVLQRIVDRGAVKRDDTGLLQALGVSLGDVMAHRLGLRWVAVEDELGTSRALRLGDSETLVFPVTMISKRVETGVRVDVAELYERTARELKAQTIPQGHVSAGSAHRELRDPVTVAPRR